MLMACGRPQGKKESVSCGRRHGVKNLDFLWTSEMDDP